MEICMCCDAHLVTKPILNPPWRRTKLGFVPARRRFPVITVKASAVDSPESSSNFAKRMDQAWIISQQPSPVGCSSCNSKGHVECKWCAGTGFFILGDNMLCQVPSRNTSCVICSGQGSACCRDCKGTGFRAKWLEKPPVPSS
ncbi:PREDICTED: uncharacterized protein LOC104713951 [Camelina sativa]|uniref:Uncharacterized protein LOC104713951 n=1 Tax=Camelina sativa TaxID=90675 RepID=A0ABM0TPV6_CAMSA|nr:PREDICTED: uncharacterized protein LOC104713951 [Camelina sativa]